MIRQIKTTFQVVISSLVGLGVLMVLNSCILQPVGEKELIGTYEGTLPDGGMENLELKSDGICEQHIVLKDGRKFSVKGTWKYDKPQDWSTQRNVNLAGIYISVGADGNIDPEIGKEKNTVRSLGVRRSLSGKVIIGYSEGTSYEKK